MHHRQAEQRKPVTAAYWSLQQGAAKPCATGQKKNNPKHELRIHCMLWFKMNKNINGSIQEGKLHIHASIWKNVHAEDTDQ